MDEDQQQIDSGDPEDMGYPPDAVDDGPGMNVPTPRAKRVRGAMQAHPAKAKTKKRLAKGSTRIHAQQKRRQAIELRKAGATYQIIADQVGYSDASAARKAVLKAYGDVIQEPVAELKTLQIERLNHMLMVLWPKVQQGDLGAMNTSLSIMNKIDHLMGTEAAREIKVQNDTAVLVVDGNKEDYIKALQKMSGAGVMPDGTNMSAQQVQALPTGSTGGPTAGNQSANRYPPGMGGPLLTEEKTEDIVDAEVVDVPEEDVVAPPVETKKKFKFGVDPTVKR